MTNGEGREAGVHDEDGDLAAFCAGVHPQLVGALTHHTGDVLLAEELAQEALVQVCRHWPRVRILGSPSGWAYRVGANLAASTFRRRAAERRANRRAAVLLSTAREPATAEHLAVREALKTLTPAQREAVLLRHYFGLSATETAELVGGTAQAVRALTHRAVTSLRRQLVDEERRDELGAVRSMSPKGRETNDVS
jgi:RNA polymerase sigma factor (sigma-70 family)